jgi:hypothetical protein
MEMTIEVVNLVLTLATLGVCVTILVRLEKLARARKYKIRARTVKTADIGGSAV